MMKKRKTRKIKARKDKTRKRKKNNTPDYDSPWKLAIEQFFPEFIQFFFPAIYDDIDWEKPAEFLDKELAKVVRDAESKKRFADVLVKVHLKDDKAIWLLAHIEVQNNRDSDFEHRMYTYQYRIFDKYQVDVVSLAILTDIEKNYRPSEYKKSRWGCQLNFKFPVIKLLDYADDWTTLEASKNPFAIIAMAHLKCRQGKDNQERKYWKTYITRLLFKQGFSKEYILELLRFLDWMIVLPKLLEIEYEQDLTKISEENNVTYLANFERKAQQQGEASMLFQLIKEKFGSISEDVQQQIEDAKSDTLMGWAKKVLTAKSIDEVFN
jgi:hypothetical protein